MNVRRKPPRRRRTAPFDFVDPDVALAAIQEATKAARRERIPIALIGGLAMSVYGSDRLTKDVDFAATRLPRFASIGSPLPFGGTRVWTPRGLELNFVVRTDEAQALFADAVAKAKRTRWGFALVRPEHLAAMKLEAGRDKDHFDLRFLLLARKGARSLVSRSRTRALVGRFLGATAAKAFDSACREADDRE